MPDGRALAHRAGGAGVGVTSMIHVGTSGWQYRDWRGVLYPDGMRQDRWLERYAQVFSVVEVNNSFYRLPEPGTFDRWRESTPPGFTFVVKASRYLTHIRRLRDADDGIRLFTERASRLGSKLGPVLFQLPPTLRRDDGLLGAFLERLPREPRSAFEFRHASWFADEVFEALDSSGAALVHPDRPGVRVDVPTVGGWSYLRFHEGRRTGPRYRRAKLRAYAAAIAGVSARDVFAFFNNDAEGAAVLDATTLIELLEERRVVAA
jgi:uncharacterized protein YecE (DUF72 family)